MKKISSSSSTFFAKKLYPLPWFVILAFFAWKTLTGVIEKDPILRVVPLLIAVIVFFVMFFMMRNFIWNSVDEVYDGGDFLLIKKHGEEERIALSNIMNVSMSEHARIPNRITLRLVNPGRFGKEIAFFPVAKFNPYAKNQVAEDLIVRVDQARSKRAV